MSKTQTAIDHGRVRRERVYSSAFSDLQVHRCIDRQAVFPLANDASACSACSIVRFVSFFSRRLQSSQSMSKSIVKKALDIIDDDDDDVHRTMAGKSKRLLSIQKKKKKKNNSSRAVRSATGKQSEPSIIQDRRQLARTCLALKNMSKPVVSSEQVEQLNNYRFGGPSKRELQLKKKKEKVEEVFTEEDFKKFEREYHPVLRTT